MLRAAILVLLFSVSTPVVAEDSWQPFAADLADELRLDSPWSSIRDGAYGSATLLLHEPGAGPLHHYRRDGLPLGTGHLWSDGPWSVSLAGVHPSVASTGGVTSGAAGGLLEFRSFSADTTGAVLDSRFFKGVQESYLRRLSYRTPRAPWILGFDFDEQILHDFDSFDIPAGENSPPYPYVGNAPFVTTEDWEAKGRIARTTLRRLQPDGSSMLLGYERLRSHAVILPAFELERREQWTERLHAGWDTSLGGGALFLGMAMNGSDLLLQQSISSGRDRRISTARNAVRGTWQRSDGRLLASVETGAWRVADEGADSWGPAGAPLVVPATRVSRQDAELRVARIWQRGGRRIELGAGAGWLRQSGTSPRLDVTLASEAGGWRLTLEHGGRAPRSDELGSSWTVATPLTVIHLLPDDDLGFERTTRAEAGLAKRMFGLDVTATASVRRTIDGIGWLEEGGAADGTRTVHWGRWANGVDLDSWTAGVRLGRTFRFAGPLRVSARLDARGWDVATDGERPLPVFLPPERSAALEARWYRAFFGGDGILELGWDVEHRSEATDPWLPGTADRIPALTLHHALVMFRLAGADLGVSFRNVLDHQGALSSGTLAVLEQDELGETSGREMRWRLQWTLRR